MRALRLLVFNLALVLTAALVLEVAFGAWLHPNRINQLNLVRDRVIHFDASALYPPPNDVTYTRDPWGLRGVYDSPGGIDIVTVGGSATDQRYISDGRTWQDVIGREFAAEGKRVTVVNAGVDGQSTYGHIQNFERWFPTIPGFRPKYILFYVGVNDFYKDPGSDYDLLASDRRPKWKTRVRESSAIYQAARTLKGMYEARQVHNLAHHHEDMSAWKWTTAALVQDPAALAKRRLPGFRARLELLADRTRAIGATPIFVTQPHCTYRGRADGSVEGRAEAERYDDTEINGVDLYRMMRLFWSTTMEVCAEKEGVCIDAANEMVWQEGDFYDPVHNTPQGAERLGRYLHDRLKQLF